MTNDNLYTPYRGPEWQIGKLSTRFHSHKDILALAQSFKQTELFLDAVGYILKRVDVVFGLRPASAEANQTFLDPPPPKDQVSIITDKLTAVYLAWQIASELNPAVASFKGETLEDLRNEIHRVNRDAIDAACNGTELQKLQAMYNSRKDITGAFYRMNRELGIHRAKHDGLAGRPRDWKDPQGGRAVSAQSGENNSLNGLNADVDPRQQVPPNWLAPRSVADLVQETGCSRTAINDEVRKGNIPGGASRENNNPRGHVILQQIGLDYLKRKGGKDKLSPATTG